MRCIVFTGQFKRDYKKRQREKKLDELLEDVFNKLSVGSALPVKFRDHLLKGNYLDCRECHLKPDLLLIYVLTSAEVRLIRLGSHSELFD